MGRFSRKNLLSRFNMNNLSLEFNRQLELDVLVNGLTDITIDYIEHIEYDKLTDVIIPEGIKHIGIHAFSGWSSLSSITIPNTVTSIDDGAFSSCWKLTNIVIPNSVTNIGSCVFTWCGKLTQLTIPASVKYIGACTFWNCDNLNNLIFEGKTIEEVRSMPNYPWCYPSPKITVI